MWRNLTATHPRHLSDGADFTPDGLKAYFEVVAMQAFAAGVKRGRGEAEVEVQRHLLRRKNYVDFMKYLQTELGRPDDGEGPETEAA